MGRRRLTRKQLMERSKGALITMIRGLQREINQQVDLRMHAEDGRMYAEYQVWEARASKGLEFTKFNELREENQYLEARVELMNQLLYRAVNLANHLSMRLHGQETTLSIRSSTPGGPARLGGS